MLSGSVLVRFTLFAAAICPASLLSQDKSAASSPTGVHEFPVQMRQKVEAGATAVGTKVQATLAIATLLDGNVIPKDAVFSGEVIESVAKSEQNPSRLSIRWDSVQWKKGSAPVKVYLTAWFYPPRDVAGQDLKYGPDVPASRTWNGAGVYPDPNSRVYRPFPDADSGNSRDAVPDAPVSTISGHRAQMKNIESVRNPDGDVAISSKKSNIKLDKLTMYVLASSDLKQTNQGADR